MNFKTYFLFIYLFINFYKLNTKNVLKTIYSLYEIRFYILVIYSSDKKLRMILQT